MESQKQIRKIDALLCLIGFHKWEPSEEGVEVCSRHCQTRRCIGECDMQVVHQDGAKSLEVCSRCGREICYGIC